MGRNCLLCDHNGEHLAFDGITQNFAYTKTSFIFFFFFRKKEANTIINIQYSSSLVPKHETLLQRPHNCFLRILLPTQPLFKNPTDAKIVPLSILRNPRWPPKHIIYCIPASVAHMVISVFWRPSWISQNAQRYKFGISRILNQWFFRKQNQQITIVRTHFQGSGEKWGFGTGLYKNPPP